MSLWHFPLQLRNILRRGSAIVQQLVSLTHILQQLSKWFLFVDYFCSCMFHFLIKSKKCFWVHLYSCFRRSSEDSLVGFRKEKMILRLWRVFLSAKELYFLAQYWKSGSRIHKTANWAGSSITQWRNSPSPWKSFQNMTLSCQFLKYIIFTLERKK